MAGRANYSAETKAEELPSPEASSTASVNHNSADRFSLLIHVDKKLSSKQSEPRRNGKSVNKPLSNALPLSLATATSSITVTITLSPPATPRCTMN